MYCGRCGHKLREGAKFCPKCGCPADGPGTGPKGTEEAAEIEKAAGKTGKKKRRRWILILVILLVLLAAAGITTAFLLHRKQVKKQFDGAMADADRFMEELDYESARASYEKAISVDPKKEEPYLKLADLYIAEHEPQKAQEIIRQGRDHVSSSGAKEELASVADEWKDLKEYEWAVEPTVEADEIYYLQSRDVFSSPENERYRQMDSEYAVIRQGDRYGLIGMDGNLVGGMDYTAVDTILGYYEVTMAEPQYTAQYQTKMSNFYLTPSGTLEPAVAMFGDAYGAQGEYYYSGGLHNTLDSLASYNGTTYWDLYEPEVPIPVRETEQTYEEASGGGEENLSGVDAWLEEAGGKYAVWADGELKTDFIYGECGSECSGLLAAEQDGKWGYINSDGEEIIPAEYDASWQHYTEEDKAFCYAASEGYVPLVKEGAWELRDAEGNLVIAPGAFEEILPVYEGKCWVRSEGRWGVISLGGSADEAEDKDGKKEASEGDSGASEEEAGQISYSSVYGPLLEQASGTGEYSQYLLYMLYDIDKNGVKELLLQTGTCEADYMYLIYTVQDGSAVYLGEIPGGHSVFFADENGGTENYIIRCSGHMSWEVISCVYLEDDGTIREEEISSREVPPDDTYYSNPYPLDSAYVTDQSLLNG